MVAVDYDGVSTKLMTILMIVLGMWVMLMSQFHTEWSHFWSIIVTVDYDGVSTKLRTILIVVFGIWVILACPNFIRSGPTFGG